MAERPEADEVAAARERLREIESACATWRGGDRDDLPELVEWIARRARRALSALTATDPVQQGSARVEPAVCNRCGAGKALHCLGESCNQNCGGKVVRRPASQGSGEAVEAKCPNCRERYPLPTDPGDQHCPGDCGAKLEAVEARSDGPWVRVIPVTEEQRDDLLLAARLFRENVKEDQGDRLRALVKEWDATGWTDEPAPVEGEGRLREAVTRAHEAVRRDFRYMADRLDEHFGGDASPEWADEIVARVEQKLDREAARLEQAYRAALRADPCAYCGEPGGVIDHITPRFVGGVDDCSNMTAACASCNCSKYVTPMLHFLLRRRIDAEMEPLAEQKALCTGSIL